MKGWLTAYRSPHGQRQRIGDGTRHGIIETIAKLGREGCVKGWAHKLEQVAVNSGLCKRQADASEAAHQSPIGKLTNEVRAV